MKCGLCGGSFIRAHNLQRHHQEIHQETSLPVACSLCKSVFHQIRHLRHHINRMHKPCTKTWQCNQCEKEYLDKGSLTRHLKENIRHICSCFFEFFSIFFYSMFWRYFTKLSLIVCGWTRIVHLNRWRRFTFHGGLCLIWFVSHFNTKYSDMSW